MLRVKYVPLELLVNSDPMALSLVVSTSTWRLYGVDSNTVYASSLTPSWSLGNSARAQSTALSLTNLNSFVSPTCFTRGWSGCHTEPSHRFRHFSQRLSRISAPRPYRQCPRMFGSHRVSAPRRFLLH